MQNLLNKLNRKIGKYSIENLMYISSGGMLLVYLAGYFLPQIPVAEIIALDWSLVMQGQVWRLITFIFDPPASSPIFILLTLYFNWLIGNLLEREWGSFRFNVYYLIGMIGVIITAALTGYGSNYYLNLSLFMSFAILYPDYEVVLFFFLPIKVKYLAILDAVYFAVYLVIGGWNTRLLILFAILNVLLFFGEKWYRNFKMWWGYRKTRRNFRRYTKR